MRLKLWQASILSGILLASAARADLVVSTITGTGPDVSPIPWDGSSSVSPWRPTGLPTPTYGETFLDPAGNPLLTGMTFEINDFSTPAIPFQAYVYAWNGTSITGPALFTSAVMSVPSASGFQAVTVPTPGTVLTPGDEYIAFYSTLGDGGDPSSTSAWGFMQNPPADNAYTDGTFEFNNSTNFSALTSPTWISLGSDLAFTLTFAPAPAAVPEPSSVFLLVTVITALGFLARRKLE